MKILSPAGNFESLRAAVFGGADEVYLGINDFNARNNIDGFTIATLKEAVDFAHLFGVKVDLAINVLFTDEELDRAIDIIVKAYQMGVDAFIIQDIALADILQNNYPQIEKHASTQMGIHNLEGVRAIERFGFKRVVLARETPLDEVKRIRENTDIEIEYFAHGALCVSFSGNCYLSAYTCSASGNRGRCKQLCRLPYTLKKGNITIKKGYLLSAKDFNMIKRLPDLKKVGVTALKIEGRARRPYYVGVATREYRKAIDGKDYCEDSLRLAFNRNFTQGYFNGNDQIISDFNNHVGIEIGKVTKVNVGKKFNQVFFTCNRPLCPKSTFKFFDNLKETNTLTAFDLKKIEQNQYVVTTTQTVTVGQTVRLIIDFDDETFITNYTTKRKIDLSIELVKNRHAKATFIIGGKHFSVDGEVCLPAKNSPLTQQDVVDCFNKNQFFTPQISLVTDGVFLAKSTLNAFRRSVYQAVFDALTLGYVNNLEHFKVEQPKIVNPLSDFEFVTNPNAKYNAKTVIYSPEEYIKKDVDIFMENCKSQGVNAYLDLPNFAITKDVEHLKQLVNACNVGVVANNWYALDFCSDVIIGGGLNVYNPYTAQFFDKPFITCENSVNQSPITPFACMTLLHCPIKTHVGGSCADCKFDNDYFYITDSGQKLKLTRKKLSNCTFYLYK